MYFADNGDNYLRQWLNLVLALAMPVTTFLAFALGTSFQQATRSDAGEAVIVPAGYAFGIWSLIYAGAVGYGIYQFLPGQRGDELLQRIGFLTASAFLGTAVWLLMARFGLIWLTVACIFWIFISLFGVFRELIQTAAERTNASYLLIVVPVSIFFGWVSVAVFANTASALKYSGLLDVGFSETVWTILMLAAATIMASWFIWLSRGNLAYALTVLWALTAIVVANLTKNQNPAVAAAAAGGAGIILIVLLYCRFTGNGLAEDYTN